MGKKVETSAPQEAVRPKLYEAQPSQVVLVNVTDDVVFALDRGRQRAWTDLPSIIFRPGVPVLVPRYMLRGLDGRGTDVTSLLKSGVLEVAADQRGALAEYVDGQYSQDRAAIRDGKRSGPNRQQRISSWVNVVVDETLAEALVDVLDAVGLPDSMEDPRTNVVVHDLVSVYDRSFTEKRRAEPAGIGADRRPWLARSRELIAIARAHQAGLIEEEGDDDG